MNRAKTQQTVALALMAPAFLSGSHAAWAVEEEQAVSCTEGSEPTPIAYGNHTEDCQIDTRIDQDTFTFIGTAGEEVRVLVQSIDLVDPKLQVRDSSNSLITTTSCQGSCTFSRDLSIVTSGPHTISIADLDQNDTGRYQLQLERLAPVFEPQNIAYNAITSDVINTPIDQDSLVFEGAQGTVVRVSVRSLGLLDPRVELRAPGGTAQFLVSCQGSCAIERDVALGVSGTYALTISDLDLNETGGYSAVVQCLSGDCPTVARPVCAGREATIFGSDADNLLVGTDGDDVIHGLGGNDVIYGLDGRDVICGGHGNDVIFGGRQGDLLYGQGGNDSIDAGHGHDRVYGGAGDDVLAGGAHNDRLFGGPGSDTLDGGDDQDTLRGEAGHDVLRGGSGDDQLYGGADADICDGESGFGDFADAGCDSILNVP